MNYVIEAKDDIYTIEAQPKMTPLLPSLNRNF